MNNAVTRTTSPPWWRLATAIAVAIGAALTLAAAMLAFAKNGNALFDALGGALLSTGVIFPYQLAALALLSVCAASFAKSYLAIGNAREHGLWAIAFLGAALCYFAAAYGCDAALRQGADSLDVLSLTHWLQVALLIAAFPVALGMLVAIVFLLALAGPEIQDWATKGTSHENRMRPKPQPDHEIGAR